MNMLIRFIYQYLKAQFSPALEINNEDSVYMRVLPNDLDLNFHLNNGRYLSLMDLGRTRLSIRTGLFKKAKKNNWGLGVAGGSTIVYLKSLALFEKFHLKTRLAGHCNGWFYIEQKFLNSKNELAAVALVKVIFLRSRKRVPVDEVIAAMEVSDIGDNQPYLEHLFNSEKEFLNHCKSKI